MKTFPITQAQFLEWLAAKPRQKCNRPLNGCGCPMVNAVFELTEERMSSFAFIHFPGLFPKWVLDAVATIDNSNLSWQTTRGHVLALFKK